MSNEVPQITAADARRARRVAFAAPPDPSTVLPSLVTAVETGWAKSRGAATLACERELRRLLGTERVTTTQSCTAALELAAILLGVGPGDEVILPSFTYASSANAFVLRGATPVFVDVRPDTLNIDPEAVAGAVTARTRAILAVHYGGVGADMDALARFGVPVLEDAAQGICAARDGRPLGTIGAMGTLSFDATKNLSAGTGGALIVGDPELAERAEVVRDCGTNRAGFARGEVDRYSWTEAGRNAAMHELAAAYLLPQLETAEAITAARVRAWDRYHANLCGIESDGWERPHIPAGCEHNGHCYRLMAPTPAARDAMLAALQARGIEAIFHYVPLHSAPAGLRHGRVAGSMRVTDAMSARIVRLPLHAELSAEDVDYVTSAVLDLARGRLTPVRATGRMS